MGLIMFGLVFGSAVFFYKYSHRTNLSKAFALMASTLSFWGFSLFWSDYSFFSGFQWTMIQLITVFPLFVPVLLTYITYNYTRPMDLKNPPLALTILHTIVIVYFLWLSWEGRLSPFVAENGESVFRGNFQYYFPYCGYIIGSILVSLFVMIRNILRGEHFVRLHSIYMFTGVSVGGFVSVVFTLVLPLLGIHLTFFSIFGLLIFLWVTWIPLEKYSLFNADLLDFRIEMRHPKISSVILEINRFFLSKLYPNQFEVACKKFEDEIEKVLHNSGSKLVLDHRRNPESFPSYLKGYIQDIKKSLFKS
ncbi:hypothetical protein EHO61_11940 [Leptospira fluminis]|uniref:Histidine kinase N-terminal 7TM region domain-containing protein n=1 Tax=Leptospira fluminis TaxID=2484979 RepID=A0A4R9GLU2_9LEPT|nr:hypothetical protein [Leptospira fluminis]TGK17130.1 hypothetical protein EHO61_11940 [Leptospira fluminis]